MNFFKRLFSSKKETPQTGADEAAAGISGIYPNAYFDQRYQEDSLKPEMVDGCLKMVESYLIENKLQRKVETRINHPLNLDLVEEEGFGFVLYCKAYRLGEEQATLFLAYAFSDYLVTEYGFRLYRDLTPEYPLRGMTLKYDRNGVVLSLYPYEYAAKFLNGGDTFTALDEKIRLQIGAMPGIDEVLQRYLRPEDDSGQDS